MSLHPHNIGHKRDLKIDFLRFLGLSLIILAHISPPNALFQLRCFDVPLMIFVSGLAYANKDVHYSFHFITRRFSRLIVPVYLFLTAYFLIVFAANSILGIDFGVRLKHVIGSYLLLEGIGYVWIIRVFLIIGLLTPMLIAINKSVKNDLLFFIMTTAVAVILTLCIDHGIGKDNVFVREYLFYGIGYSPLFLLGLRLKNVSKNRLIVSVIICLCLLLIVASIKHFSLDFNNYKYPPQLYFLVYGAFMSLLCFCVVKIYHKISNLKTAQFIGSNSIWIYLYHIPFVQITGNMNMEWLVRYTLVYACAVTAYYAQYRLANRYLRTSGIYKFLIG